MLPERLRESDPTDGTNKVDPIRWEQRFAAECQWRSEFTKGGGCYGECNNLELT
jgi:hypothetical protein